MHCLQVKGSNVGKGEVDPSRSVVGEGILNGLGVGQCLYKILARHCNRMYSNPVNDTVYM